MKTCPVCKSLCFDDMPVCYGCMHDFERDVLDEPEEAVEPAASRMAVPAKESNRHEAPGIAVSSRVASGDGSARTRSFGASGSVAPADTGMRPIMSLPIPMLTSTFACGQRPDTTANLAARTQGAASQRSDNAACAGVSSCAGASPWLTLETPGGCRLTLHLEPA